MDLSPSPFWIRNKHQQTTLVFDFSNVSNERCNDDYADDENSEVLIGKNYSQFASDENLNLHLLIETTDDEEWGDILHPVVTQSLLHRSEEQRRRNFLESLKISDMES